MRRFAPSAFLAVITLSLFFSGCGGDSKTPDTSKVISKIVVTPDPVSLNRGAFLSVSPVAQNSKGDTLAATFTFTSDNENLATISSAGEVCAGKWNSAFTVCNRASSTGVANVTIAAKDTSVKTTVKVYVHQQIDAIRIQGQAANSCISALNSQTLQLTASAYSNDPAVCGGTTPCALDPATVGKFTWNVNALDSNVLTVDDTAAKQGLVTAKAPGRAFVTALISNVVSAPSPVTVCPVVSIDASIKDSTDTTFALDKAKTKALTAVVKDSAGKTLTTGPFVWYSTQSSAMAVAAGTTGLTATATAGVPGNAALLASCVPPGCNKNLYPVYSNIIGSKANGTSTGTVYVASTQSTSLVPIAIDTGKPGTAITLPRVPNSFLMNRQGTKAALGSDSGTMLLDTASGSIITMSNIFGKPIAFSPNGTLVVVSDAAHGRFFIYDVTGTASSIGFASPDPVTGAAFNTESSMAYIVGGKNIFIWSTGLGSTNQAGIRQLVVPTNLTDVALPTRSDTVYLAGSGTVDVRAVCNFATVDTLGSTNPTLIRPILNGNGLLLLNSPNIDVISITSTGVGCPLPAPAGTIQSHDLGVGSFTPRQLLVSSDSSKAYVTSNLNSISVFDIDAGTATKLDVSGSPVLGQADITLDGKLLYVVGADSKVHKFDLTNSTEGTPITVSLKKSDNTAATPNLLQIRSQ